MTSGLGQPVIPGSLVVEMSAVTAVEGAGLPPANIINQPNTFTLNATFTIKDTFAPLLDGDVFNVQHHFTRLEDGQRFRLDGGPLTAALVNGEIVMPYTSPSYTTGANGTGKQLEIPPGETEGAFRVLTQLVAQNPNIRRVVHAFQDGLILTVV